MAYKRVLTIQDISCVGQCSMTVAMPILSVCGHETCILPTAVLSTHTGGFGKPVVHHLSGDMGNMAAHWRDQGITFDAILVGYLGSLEAVSAVETILDTLLSPEGVTIVDPAMADHGRLYSGFNEAYAKAMGRLCAKADIIVPNITEAAMLAGMEYREEYDEYYICRLLDGLDTKTVILTGVGFLPGQTGAAIHRGNEIQFYHHRRIGKSYHGTGDIFAACFTGALMQGTQLEEAVKIALEFTCRCIQSTMDAPAHWYGVKFETVLPWLAAALADIS